MIDLKHFLCLIYIFPLSIQYFTLQLDTIKVSDKVDIYFFARNLTLQLNSQLRDSRLEVDNYQFRVQNDVQEQQKQEIVDIPLASTYQDHLASIISIQDELIVEDDTIKQVIINKIKHSAINLQENNITSEQINSTNNSYSSQNNTNFTQDSLGSNIQSQSQNQNNNDSQYNNHTIFEEDIKDKVQQNEQQILSDASIDQNKNEIIQNIVPLNNYYNYQYIGQVNVLEALGSIKQYRVIFDSGSSWVWLPKNNCNGCPSNKNTGFICQDNSAFCQQSSESMNVTYGMGAINGSIAEGLFAFNQNIDDFKRVKFLLVENAWGMEGALYQGIIGLELDNKDDRLISWPVGFYLSYGDDSSTRENSQINFGGINQNLVKPNEVMQYVPVNQHWIMDVEEFQIIYQPIHNISEYSISTPNISISLKSQHDSDVYSSQSLKVVVDSGSSLLMLPKQQLQILYKSFQDHEIECQKPELSHTSLKCSCPTQNKAIFPTFLLIFKNQVQISLEPQYYIHTTVDSHVCHVLVSPLSSHDDDLIIMGNPFMRKYYTLFDKENRQIGLAQSINTLKKKKFLDYTSLFSYIVVVGCSFTTAYLVIAILNYAMKNYLYKKEIAKIPQQQRMNYRLV